MSQLFAGIDVRNQNNEVYLMKPDGEKHSSFWMQNIPVPHFRQK